MEFRTNHLWTWCIYHVSLSNLMSMNLWIWICRPKCECMRSVCMCVYTDLYVHSDAICVSVCFLGIVRYLVILYLSYYKLRPGNLSKLVLMYLFYHPTDFEWGPLNISLLMNLTVISYNHQWYVTYYLRYRLLFGDAEYAYVLDIKGNEAMVTGPI